MEEETICKQTKIYIYANIIPSLQCNETLKDVSVFSVKRDNF